MEEMIFYDRAKSSVVEFFEKEFENFPPLLMSHFLNKFNDLLNYTEEGRVIRPKIVFTNNVDSIIRSINKCQALTLFEDADATKFNSRLKSILPIIKDDWCLFIEIKENKVSYGAIMTFTSIKDRSFLRTLLENTSLKNKSEKINCIVARPMNFYTMSLHSISGNDMVINFSLDTTKNNVFQEEINEFVSAVLSKLKTTQRKLQDMKNMYLNILSNVMSYVNGSICVVVDKDYKDNGLFEDGIWLKEPIPFSKLFTQSKSYNEEKLQAYADLLLNMLAFDGITILDNLGRLRAYNVFVEPNSKKVGYIVGGARKRAAYHILSTRKKDIIGVYFQSHEGEIFFQEVPKREAKIKKASAKKEVKEQEKQKTETSEKTSANTALKETTITQKEIKETETVSHIATETIASEQIEAISETKEVAEIQTENISQENIQTQNNQIMDNSDKA